VGGMWFNQIIDNCREGGREGGEEKVGNPLFMVGGFVMA